METEASIVEQERLKTLKPFVMAKVKRLLHMARKKWPEHSIVLTETYRSQGRQDMLYARGPATTTVRVSMHTKRLAADIYFMKAGRKLQYKEAPYLELGELGESMGFRWGGRWKIPWDPWHFEIPKEKTTRGILDELYSKGCSHGLGVEHNPTKEDIDQALSDIQALRIMELPPEPKFWNNMSKGLRNFHEGQKDYRDKSIEQIKKEKD